ncbi:ribonuclease HI [Pseudoalteromonas sp. SSDWG2]|uniref:ribonuclease HI n=1 Tax=Pseudoalteromonas sp. SSDWG2 TaxID=3139391 RepID=UPI003BAA1677
MKNNTLTPLNDTTIYAYTDGACQVNLKLGGWGFILKRTNEEGEQKVLQRNGGARNTTNNKMELTAAINALQVVLDKHPEKPVVLTTDSKYVIDGINTWIVNWKKNNWINSSKKSVLNQDLWKQLDELNSKLSVTWKWVKGHSGPPENEQADQLATAAIPRK